VDQEGLEQVAAVLVRLWPPGPGSD
jgi:hypothetical protein